MQQSQCLRAVFGCLAALACGQVAAAQQVTAVRITAGVVRPLYVTAPPGDFTRIFIVSQRDTSSATNPSTGRIRIYHLDTETLNPVDFLTISGVSANSEQGVLGLAFHPDYAENGYFFVNYTEAPTPGFSVIKRFRRSTADPDVSDPDGVEILRIAQPFANHNGGWIGFGPDGYLYCSFGDGGSQNDPGNRGQDITSNLLGKLLRIDVDGPNNIVGDADDDELPEDATRNYAIPPTNPFVGLTGDDEIWAYGLRNPWRPAFDRETGDLFIADVGQDAIEELNFQPAAALPPKNYGWRCMEGLNCTGRTGCTCNDAALTLPFHTYEHTPNPGGRCSVTGGYVYRGCSMPWLRGTYFFADYCAATIWSMRYSPATGVTEFTDRTAELDPPDSNINSITSFGEDARGELYICDQGGEVFKLVPATPADCNQNSIPDHVEIARGDAPDCNCNGVVDTCNNDGDPDVLVPPQAGSGCIGRPFTLSVSAAGPGPLHYVWRRDGDDIGAPSTPTLMFPAFDATDAGTYDVVITGACGQVISPTAAITAQPVGDANCDLRFDNFDIDPFVFGLVNGQAAWAQQFGCSFLCGLDIDNDARVSNFDIDPFVALLVGN